LPISVSTQAWRHGVDRHTFGREPHRVTARQTFEPGLGGGVSNAHAAGADAGSDRRHVDDPAKASRPHARQDGLGAKKGRLQIDRHGVVEILLGDVVEAARRRHAGVVHQNVDRAEARFDVTDHCLHRAANRDVGTEGRGAAAALADRSGDGLCLRGAGAIVDRNRRAGFRAKAIALPMPREPPVTSATRFFKSGMRNPLY
jgi:hypothetical protein